MKITFYLENDFKTKKKFRNGFLTPENISKVVLLHEKKTGAEI